jgi:NAD(P)-dependent dehydrogenase (short-subunit alcohol dehydrogenase family)
MGTALLEGDTALVTGAGGGIGRAAGSPRRRRWRIKSASRCTTG